LLIIDSPGGYCPVTYIFRKPTVFKIFAVKWQKSVSERPKMVHVSPFLDPAFGDP